MTPQGADHTPSHTPSHTDATRSRETFVLDAVREYQSVLIGYAHTILRDRELAQDAVQETFLRLCAQAPENVRGHLRSWLFTVCRNLAIDKLRKAKPFQAIDEVQWKKVAGPDLAPDEQLRRNETHSRILALIDRLTDNQREVILLKFHQGLSYKEIAAITGLGDGNIGYLIHNGIKRIRELLPPDLKI